MRFLLLFLLFFILPASAMDGNDVTNQNNHQSKEELKKLKLPAVSALPETPEATHTPRRKERHQSTNAKILAAFALKVNGEGLLNQAFKENRQDLIFDLIEDVEIKNSHYMTILASELSLQEKKTYFVLLAKKAKPDTECLMQVTEYINAQEKLLSILKQDKKRLEEYKLWKSELQELCSENEIEVPSDCTLS